MFNNRKHMTELKNLLLDLVQVVVTLFTGTVENKMIFQEVDTEWWKVKNENTPHNIHNGIR